MDRILMIKHISKKDINNIIHIFTNSHNNIENYHISFIQCIIIDDVLNIHISNTISVLHQNITIYQISKSDLLLIIKDIIIKYSLHISINRLQILQHNNAKNINYPLYASIILSYICIHVILPFQIVQLGINIQHIIGILLQGYSMINYVYLQKYTKQLSFFPIYTILVPMYKEFNKIQSIIEVISELEYPKNKLDVKIIIEDDDTVMKKELALYNIPTFVEVIIIPNVLPKTKPKALNYAMLNARGDFITVFDADDKPDKKQLIDALNGFYNHAEKYICMQAKLCFYNHDENLLTYCISFEYIIWYECMQTTFSLSNLPVFLGGTSNHFKKELLIKIGLWDAYNVTEDADLSIRLYNKGYKTGMINSYTQEEAPIYLYDWLKQRSRWIKGFLQTWHVFIFSTKKQMNIYQMIFVHCMLICGTLNFFSLPILIMINFIDLSNSYIKYVLYTNLLLQNILRYYVMSKFQKQRSFFMKMIFLLLFQCYFILHSIASYMALYEIIVKPFHWNKTKHGVSSILDLERDKSNT